MSIGSIVNYCGAAWWALAVAGACKAAGPGFSLVAVSPQNVGPYERVTVTFSLGRTYENPYDPDQIEVSAEIEGPGPGARILANSATRRDPFSRLVVPAFWHEPYEPASDFTARHVFTNPGMEEYRRAGDARWEVRFAPTQIGTWRGRLRAKDADGESLSEEFVVTCASMTPPSPPSQGGENHGYLRPAANGQFLRFDTPPGPPIARGGVEGFVPVGMCIAWARGQGEKDTYDDYLPRLAQAGGNTVRVWMCHWAWLEWTQGEPGALQGYAGAGRYNQQVAYNFDRLLDLAERSGIYVQLCLNNACWEFGRPDGKDDEYDSWGGHPYNARNGGPCQQPEEFWSHPEARRLYRNKLRYIAARWGYSPHVLAWELWNEQSSESEATAVWHQEMADYLRRIDPYRHLVTTSTWVSDARELSRTFAAMDLLQLHYAGERSVRLARETFPAIPLVIGEGPWSRGAMIRAGYASPLLGAAGPPLTWHSGADSEIERPAPSPAGGGGSGRGSDLYRVMAAMADFWRGFPAAAPQVRLLRARRMAAKAPEGPQYAPVVLQPGFNTWLKQATQAEFEVSSSGEVDTSGMSDRLYGSNPDRAPYRNPPTLVVDYPVTGAFAVQVGECSGPSVLVLTLDGRELRRFEVPGEGRRSPPAEAQWQTLEVPAGPHRITVDNAGHDWMAVGPFVFVNYRDVSLHPPVTALGLAAEDQARIWVANDWTEVSRQIGLAPAPGLSVSMAWDGLRPGEWEIVWLEPGTGQVVRQESRRADENGLGLEIPAMRDQVSARLRRVGD